MTTKTQPISSLHSAKSKTFVSVTATPSMRRPVAQERCAQPGAAKTNSVDLYLRGKASVRALDPVMTRKGKLAHPSDLVMAAGAVVFGAYVFNVMGVQAFFNTTLLDLNQAAHSEDHLVTSSFLAVLPYLAAIAGLALLFPIFGFFQRSVQESSRARRLASRRPVTMEEFIHLAKSNDISLKVSREAYRLLKPYYNNRMRARLSDDLAGDLSLSASTKADIFGTLLYQTDRRTRAGEPQPRIDTVLDLLLSVEHASPRSIS